jgi:hypothetical protein
VLAIFHPTLQSIRKNTLRNEKPALEDEAPSTLDSRGLLRPEGNDALAYMATVGDPGVSPGMTGTVVAQAPGNVVIVIATITPATQGFW